MATANSHRIEWGCEPVACTAYADLGRMTRFAIIVVVEDPDCTGLLRRVGSGMMKVSSSRLSTRMTWFEKPVPPSVLITYPIDRHAAG